VPALETIEATNPCGEQPLASQRRMQTLAPSTWTSSAGPIPLKHPSLGGAGAGVRLSVRFLDDVIQVNPYPLAEIMEEVQANRRIGLGVMGGPTS